jgi:hypothetical protein
MKLDNAMDEILNLKSHMAVSIPNLKQDLNTGNPDEQQQVFAGARYRQHDDCKPTVLLVGTSNISKINENKLTNSVEIIKQMCFTLDETRNYITEARLPTTPVAVVLHVLTNDLKTKSPQVCVKELSEIIEIIRNKWSPECIISLTKARQDDMMHSRSNEFYHDQHLSVCTVSTKLKSSMP